MWEIEKSEKKKREAPCKCWKERGRWDKPTAASPETTPSRTQSYLWSRLCQPSATPRVPSMKRASSVGQGLMLQNPVPSPSRPRQPGGLSCQRFQPLLTWGPQAGRGWGARAPAGEDRSG